MDMDSTARVGGGGESLNSEYSDMSMLMSFPSPIGFIRFRGGLALAYIGSWGLGHGYS